MSFDREGLISACRREGRVARVVVARVAGSTPRETGASMLVWQTGQSGTIGGGELEFSAARAAREMLDTGRSGRTKHALGPDMGQCCGGAVELLTEIWTLQEALDLPTDVVARGSGAAPLEVRRILAQMRNAGQRPEPALIGEWMVEPVTASSRHVWIWGAGHVGRAIVSVMAPLPDVTITWVDTADDRFPDIIPPGVQKLPAATPRNLVRYAPSAAEHLILTYSHALDLELCHQLLLHGFGFAGLIGSATKWARFRKRLAALGHTPEHIAGITCPIGEPALGKHPQEIALGVATDLHRRRVLTVERLENSA
ncbi:xanthine dehydrogenase accessory protein XdhC [uncultured Roseobacter sp.]|uniref:xanthine dehydrogenase accessory protein XdhC n=1 Tax=uncultured Roseobacter sp. TaxID=114847 RepID=UPI0026147DF1|nr:xanthine dehydrogenase accessory protein XdhC [uncultured Roseobacter sp.]